MSTGTSTTPVVPPPAPDPGPVVALGHGHGNTILNYSNPPHIKTYYKVIAPLDKNNNSKKSNNKNQDKTKDCEWMKEKTKRG